MTSIRRKLLAWLLAGLGLLWLTGGVAVYSTVRTSLTGRFDAELTAMASEVRYLVPEGRLLKEASPSAYAFDFFQTGSGLYFEVWDADLLFSDRSPNLGERTLPRPAAFSTEPAFWDVTLETGENLRCLAQQFILAPAQAQQADQRRNESGPLMNVIVARARDGLDRSLNLLLAALGLAGILLVPLSVLIVRVAVGRSLRPLRTLTERVSTVDIDSLDERFESAGLPAELVPICRRLNELMQRLEQGIERERRLNADLAHELRTPVTELKTMAEVALNWPEKIRGEHYQEVLGVARQMQSVIEGMLLLAHWDRGIDRPAREPVSIPDMVETCWQPHAQAAAEKGLTLRREIRPEAALQTNRELFQTILANLISNAVEYSPAGASVVIESGPDNGRFRLSIANPVNGLNEEDLPRLFERFWRYDTARTGAGHAGLGLSLAKSCAGVLFLDLSAKLRNSTGTIVFVLTEQTPAERAP